MQTQSPAHHQLDAARLWLLPCARHLWPAAQRAWYERRQVKPGYVPPVQSAGRQSRLLLERKEGSVVVVLGS